MKESVSRKINIGGDQPLCLQFPGLYEVVSVKNLTVLVVLGNTFLFSWNFTSTEIELLWALVSFLNSMHFSFFAIDSKAWSLPFLGLFIVIFFSWPCPIPQILSCSFQPSCYGIQKALQRLRPLLG